ncbi:MAG: bifunctional demethylmenaquinone methyltransferase/2-methoxy-6-polyprenyl-1,4-benzoquinol methylase UbiE [Bacteroidales bacterium]|nr:bifunctional demethylmenaquinone methyltransferase/2-methoxy-6-polyprenyl-1,4-benzoquinol methylase UbiE [Bacteroidales bacterium]
MELKTHKCPIKDESDEKINSEIFDEISETYDSVNHILSFGIDRFWRRRFVKPLKQLNDVVLLDIATGTGEVPKLLKNFNMSFIGIDPSQKMLNIASQKLKDIVEDKRLELILGSAENIPLKNNSVDIVSVTFGVRNFENIPQAFSEIYRVLKSKGKFMILEFSLPKNKITRGLYIFYLMHVLPLIGRIFTGNGKAYKYLHTSIICFAKNCDLSQELVDSGFKNIQIKKLSLGVVSIYSAEKE